MHIFCLYSVKDFFTKEKIYKNVFDRFLKLQGIYYHQKLVD